MGAYSSWNSTALAHHFLLFIACKRSKKVWSLANYVILGDDLVIRDKTLAIEYFKLLDMIGVEFSKEKTHVSETTFEFAKRFIHNGSEITPFPLTALYSSRSKPEMVYALVLEEQNKGWFQNQQPLDVYDRWLEYSHTPGKRRRVLKEDLFPTHQVMMALLGRMSEDEAVMPIVNKFFPSIVDKLEERKAEGGNPCRSILQSICLQCFAESNEDSGETSLGAIALDLVIYATSLDIHPDEQSNLISSIPHLGVQGLIEKMYLDIQQSNYEIDTLFKGDWKLGLKALAIPLSDEVFYLRNQDLRITSSRKLGNMLIGNLEQLAAYPQLI
jgi:hypothetical protein